MSDFRYQQEKGFADPNMLKKIMAYTAIIDHRLLPQDECSRDEYACVRVAHERSSPFYTVDEDTISKLNDTKISKDIAYEDIKLPLESCVFLLPDGKMMIYTIMDHFESKISDFKAASSDGGKWFFMVVMEKFNAESIVCKYKMTSSIGESFDYEGLTPIEESLADDYRFLCMKMIMLLQARPDLKTSSKIIKKSKNGRAGLRTMRSLKAGSLSMSKIKHGGQSSPSMHVRKGHFRNQPIGPKPVRSYDLIWIEPMLIGAKNDNF